MSDLFRDLDSHSVFKDRSILSFDYVPKELPHRNEDQKKMARMYDQVIKGKVNQNMLVTGPVGCGKTVTTRIFFDQFIDYAKEMNRKVEAVYINCRQAKSENMVLIQTLRHFDKGFPDRGFSNPEMLATLGRKLEQVGCHCVVILDEADFFIKKAGSDLIYSLTRFHENHPSKDVAVSVVLISPKYSLDLLDDAALSTFGRSNVVALEPYDSRQLYDIIVNRVELAFRDGTMDDDTMQIIAEMAASEKGDARLAIELLDNAGTQADEAGQKLVTPDHARAAKAYIKPHITSAKIDQLEKHKQLVVLAASRALRHQTYVRTGDIEKNYQVVCEEIGERPRGHTQLWQYIKDLDSWGIFRAKTIHSGTSGTTTSVTLLDIPAKELVDYLENKFLSKK